MRSKTAVKVTVATLSVALLTFSLQLSAREKAAPGVREALSIDGAVPATNVTLGPPAVGTIQYDNNTPFEREPTLAGTVGNRFENLNDPHSITTVSFGLGGNYGASVIASVWDVNAASAVNVARQQIYGLANSPAATARFSAVLAAPVTMHSGSFIAGIRNSSYSGAIYQCGLDSGLASTCDGVALTEGTADPGSGFHAARVNWPGGGVFVPTTTQVATTGQDLGNQNAIFRVTGVNLPVELMSFGVD